MRDLPYSAFLKSILDRASAFCDENMCSGMTRDYIIVAALTILREADTEKPQAAEEEEYQETVRLLKSFDREQAKLNSVLVRWNCKVVPRTEREALSLGEERADQNAKKAQALQITADVYLREVLAEETDAIKSIRRDGRSEEHDTRERSRGGSARTRSDEAEDGTEAERPAPKREEAPLTVQEMIEKAKAMQTALQREVKGQQYAVSSFVASYFQSELQARIEKERKRPRITYLFAGPSGVGKTFLAEQAARALGLEFHAFDMSALTTAESVNELIGTDKSYKGCKEGELTRFVTENPHCVLLFDEIEKARIEVLQLFLQILDQGRVRDNYTDEEVSFRDCILIFTTNAGKQLYEGAAGGNLSAMPRDVVLDALIHDVNPRTGDPYFPPALCSRFASGNVVMFNYLDAYSLRSIAEDRLNRHIENMRKTMGVDIRMDQNVPLALLLAEGASADARTVNGRVDAFFGGELYEFYRLYTAQPGAPSADTIRSIRISVRLDKESEDVKRLFCPAERIHAVVFAGEPFSLDESDPDVPVIHYVHSVDEAADVIALENVQLVFCDLFSDMEATDDHFLNREDIASPSRDFLYEMLHRFPDIPVVLTETKARAFTEEEKVSYLRRGVRNFLSIEAEGLTERVREYSDGVFQQASLSALARSNRLIRYETAQSAAADGASADILLFDMKLEKAVKAEDAKSIMSMMSTPDQRFEDVIGAEDAKRELQFFITYMKSARKYRKKGAATPKGLLLYGPPGTGKTMLAKAFAAECHATFIATEGNRFHTGYVGAGPALVHQLFATARRYAPAVIFIDEIDTIARARTGRDTDMSADMDAILTALFSEMDGFYEHTGQPVFVLAATNYGVEAGDRLALDPALLRRFDRRIMIDLPSLENRKTYLKREIARKEIFHVTDQGVDSLADRSTGMSLAQLASVLDMAVRSVLQKEGDAVNDQALEEAFETFNSGESKRWDAETTLRTARHEAGHAILSWLAGDKPAYVTIVSRKDYGGYMQHANQEERMGYTRRELLARIRTALGGRAAELVCYGPEDGVSTGASGDLRYATELAKQMQCRFGMNDEFGLAVVDPENTALSVQVQQSVNQVLRDQMAEAIRVLTQKRGMLDRLVERLLSSSSLRAEEINEILSGQD